MKISQWWVEPIYRDTYETSGYKLFLKTEEDYVVEYEIERKALGQFSTSLMGAMFQINARFPEEKEH